MSFNEYEISNSRGRPIALYEVRWGSTIWRYTSADSVQSFVDPVTKVRNDFLPVSIRDSGMTQGGSDQNDFLISLQSDLPIVVLFADAAPSLPVWVKVRRKHADDPDDEAPVYWVGKIANVVTGENSAESEVRGVSIAALLKTRGLRMTWNKNCPHCIYDSGCTVDPTAHEYDATVKSVDGNLLLLTAPVVPAEGTFTGGYVEWLRDNNIERRGIEEAVEPAMLRVMGRLPGLVVGASVKLYPGCDQTASTCDKGFNNIENNGGFFFLPEKSPFNGSQVF